MTPVVLTVMLLVAGTLLVLWLFLRGLRLVGREKHPPVPQMTQRALPLLIAAARNDATSMEALGQISEDAVYLRSIADVLEAHGIAALPLPYRSEKRARFPLVLGALRTVSSYLNGEDHAQPGGI